MKRFRKGQQVVRIIRGPGLLATATLAKVASLTKVGVRLDSDEHLRYSETTGYEINPIIPGFTSEIVPLEEY
jgi:hypothetical protein